MDVGHKVSSEIELIVHHSVVSLIHIIKDFSQKEIELIRICRLAVLLKKSGINPENILYKKIAKRCIEMQNTDGGWSNVPETMWCACFLYFFDEYTTPVERAIKWISMQNQKMQGWGSSIRDSARIPITGLLLYLLPQLSSNIYLKWLENEWKKERQFEPCLNYKAAFTLMAFNKNNYHPEDNKIILETTKWLVKQQNEDGGWAPWKNHPVGSDPWCTGICLVSLLNYSDELSQKILFNGIEWIKRNQLPNGLWTYHYIEEGSIWALYALIMAYNFFYKIKND